MAHRARCPRDLIAAGIDWRPASSDTAGASDAAAHEIPKARSMTDLNRLRREAVEAPESGIVAVIDYARAGGHDGLIPLWAGEGDLADAGLHHRGCDGEP